jgi:hypothetical protein
VAGGGAERRVWAAMPPGTEEALTALSDSDLRSWLLSVARRRARRTTPADVIRRWAQDRFVRPAQIDPRACIQTEARLWELLPDHVQGVELSPVVPLGTSSALGPVGQDKVMTTMRLVEVVSDSTNALAVEAAVRRRGQPRAEDVHLAASQRQLRAQMFGAGLSAHFRLFALVSSARDQGSAQTEARLLLGHLQYWRSVLATLVPQATPQVEVSVFDGLALHERVHDRVLPNLSHQQLPVTVPVVADNTRRHGRGYYTSGALRLVARENDRDVELGDGGFTDWTAKLLGDAKERCLVSCISVDRLSQLCRQ